MVKSAARPKMECQDRIIAPITVDSTSITEKTKHSKLNVEAAAARDHTKRPSAINEAHGNMIQEES